MVQHAGIHSARWAAAQRFRESERPDALFRDPLARCLAGDEGLALLQQWEQAYAGSAATSAFVAIRTRCHDDLAARCAAEGVRQVVLLGAGMDARAFRLSWPAGTTVFECDHAELLDQKQRLLAEQGAVPACSRVPVPANLAADWSEDLTGHGFSAQTPALWIAEGFLHYLQADGVEKLLGQVSHSSAPGSVFGADLASWTFFTSPWTKPALQALADCGMVWRFGTDTPEVLFASHGWRAQVHQPGDPHANFGRWSYPVYPRRQSGVPRSFLVVARKS